MQPESPAPGRKTVLIVEDDPGTRRVLASGLATTLGMFDVLTAEHGQEAVEILDRQLVDVVVTDLAMPIMDGFALIGALSNRAAAPPVVVLSALAPNTVAEGLDGYSGLTVLRKPAGYPEVARAVLDALERHALGQVAGIPLASVLQLVEAERRSCTLAVASGRRRGRLYFESGRLINAFSEDFGADGEAAAYDILSWDRTAIEFERLPDAVRRTIQQSTQALLIEVARRQDGLRATPPPVPIAEARAAAAPPAEPEPADADGGAVSAPADAAPAETALEGATDGTGRDDATSFDGGSSEGALEEGATAIDDGAPNGTTPESPAPQDEAFVETPIDGGQAPDAAADVPELFAPEAAPPPAAPEATPERDAPLPMAAVGRTAFEPDAPDAGWPDLVDAPVADLAAADVTPAPAAATPGFATPTAAPEPAPTPAGAPSDTPSDARSSAPSGAHAGLIEAIERLTRRVLDADAALEAVAEEVTAFRAAQRRYDEAAEREERRRVAVAEARRDVARLAHQILERMDGLFALEGGDAPTGDEAAGTSDLRS